MSQHPKLTRRRTLGMTLLLAALGCAPAKPEMRVALPTRQFMVDHLTLPSGLQIVVEEDQSAHAVASALCVSAGSADDPEQQGGMAHLIEHLSFRSHPEGQPILSTRLARYGVGLWNAETTPDTTTYYEVGAPETLPRLIEVAL